MVCLMRSIRKRSRRKSNDNSDRRQLLLERVRHAMTPGVQCRTAASLGKTRRPGTDTGTAPCRRSARPLVRASRSGRLGEQLAGSGSCPGPRRACGPAGQMTTVRPQPAEGRRQNEALLGTVHQDAVGQVRLRRKRARPGHCGRHRTRRADARVPSGRRLAAGFRSRMKTRLARLTSFAR